jgi:hypothetical protein
LCRKQSPGIGGLLVKECIEVTAVTFTGLQGSTGPCNQLHDQYALEVGDEPYENVAHVVRQETTAEPKLNNRTPAMG